MHKSTLRCIHFWLKLTVAEIYSKTKHAKIKCNNYIYEACWEGYTAKLLNLSRRGRANKHEKVYCSCGHCHQKHNEYHAVCVWIRYVEPAHEIADYMQTRTRRRLWLPCTYSPHPSAVSVNFSGGSIHTWTHPRAYSERNMHEKPSGRASPCRSHHLSWQASLALPIELVHTNTARHAKPLPGLSPCQRTGTKCSEKSILRRMIEWADSKILT